MSDQNNTVKRTHLHKRQIEVQGFLREDGLWEVEGLLFDTKSYPLEVDSGKIPVGQPLHDMTFTLTVDDSLKIVDARATLSATPYKDCPNAGETYAELIGIRIKSGWMDEVKQKLKRNKACTHLTELLPTLATAVIQTIRGYHLNFTPEYKVSDKDKSKFLDTCYGLRTGGRADRLRWGNKN